MTENEFESLVFGSEQAAYEAGLGQYGAVELVTNQNPDGTWFVYPAEATA